MIPAMVLFSITSDMHGRGSKKKEMNVALVARVAIRSSVLLGAMVLTNRAWDCFISRPFKERYDEIPSSDDDAKCWEAAKTIEKCLRFIVNAYFAKTALSKSFWR